MKFHIEINSNKAQEMDSTQVIHRILGYFQLGQLKQFDHEKYLAQDYNYIPHHTLKLVTC